MDQQDVLATIRTLLAFERNYLAEERTALAEFRTGLALIVIGPAASTILAYILVSFTSEVGILLDVSNILFFSSLTLIGIWISVHSRSKLQKIKRRKRILKDRQLELAQSSEPVYNLLQECLNFDEGSELHSNKK